MGSPPATDGNERREFGEEAGRAERYHRCSPAEFAEGSDLLSRWLARVSYLAIKMIGDENRAESWLRAPCTYLGNETPISMLDTEAGVDLVVESLYAIGYGGVG